MKSHPKESHGSETSPPEHWRQRQSSEHNRQGLVFWLLLAGLLAGGGLTWGLLRRQNGTEAVAAIQPIAVEVEQLQTSQVKIRSEFVGALEAQDRVMLRPEVEGRIAQILVENGALVSAGTPILQLNPERSQAVVSSAIADVEVARASRNTAQAELLAAEADRDSAIAEKDLQDTEYERTQTLVLQGALSQQSLDQVTRNRDAAIAALTAAERRIQAAQASLEETAASLRRAESNATVATDDLSDYQVTAPIEGVVGDLLVKVGDYVSTGELLTTLTRNQTLELRLSIPVERAGDLRQGLLPVELRTEAGAEPLVVGRISFVAERVEDGAQSILAKATFPNPGGILRDEQFVRATVIWSEEPGVLAPTTAISRIGGQNFVFVMKPAEDDDGTYVAEQRPIQLGGIEGNSYHVISGLDTGEIIVTAGILRLSDGTPITPEFADSTSQ
ncbi:MAG: efflux RND transporter periplasmic adaptor subunit [Leptolyngbyaceae cyanobacterium MO_188.B28]|nr:efflux RND transporter periplasmic adaptor subunit [Leptolyngbyaceae cyanobacterium MO_188.B28]